MNYALPKRNILKYSFLLSLAVSLISFLGSFMNDEGWAFVTYRAINTFTLFYLFCVLNLFLLESFQKKQLLLDSNNSENDNKHFFCGLFFSYMLFIASHAINEYLAYKGFVPKTLMRNEVMRLGNWLYVFLFVFSTIMYAMVYFLHSFIILEDWKIKVDLENSRLKSVHAETVNHLLKQQIQPHFLFNALNVLKSLIRKYPDVAEEYLISLSDFLRASVNQNKKTAASLKEEIKICTDYMEMQKIRFNNAIDFRVEIEENNEEGFLPVFSLQPLVENAIKHNELTNSSPLFIRIKREGDWIEVRNNLQPKGIMLESSGNGLSNLAERYRILSGDSIQINETPTYFAVKIKILGPEFNNSTI